MRNAIGLIAGLLILGLGFIAIQPRPDVADCTSEDPVWSNTNPPINLSHIFCGEIKSDGALTGYHALAKHLEEGEAVVAAIFEGPNDIGIYTGQVCMAVAGPDPCKFSSLFPDDWSQQQVIDAILAAYDASGATSGQWRGPSGQGFDVQGWLNDEGTRINTAYPLYE